MKKREREKTWQLTFRTFEKIFFELVIMLLQTQKINVDLSGHYQFFNP